MLKQLKPALIIFLSFAILTGILYPLAITGIAQVIFPRQANGSLITSNGKVVGSALIGQQFDQPKYFWGRLSAINYDASTSGGTNYSNLNPALEKQVSDRMAALKTADPGNNQPVPVDLVTASGSGLDPDISIAAAQYQAPRVARLRGIALDKVMALIAQHTQGRMLGFLGEPRVNVLELNLALDAIK
jgi:potassium-transporting ATPase KdpC subunit